MYLNNYLLKVKERLMSDIHFTLGKHLLIFIHYYVILPLLGQWNILNMPWLYSVEQGRNTVRCDERDLWFLFPIGMNFSAVNCKAHKNFFKVTKNT